MKKLLLFAVFMTTAIAGFCGTEGVAQSSQSAVIYHNVMIPMRDGVRLAADIYVPSEDGVKPARQRYPILLMRTPYNKQAWADSGYNSANARLINNAGYIAAFQDVRGAFASEGGLRPMLNEGTDGYDTVAWLIEQPWSDGRVGTFGSSYMGGTQILLAAERPPGLMAGFAQVSATDQFRNEWVYMDGAFMSTAAWWSSGMVTDAASRMSQADYDRLKADFAMLGIPKVDPSAISVEARMEMTNALPLRDIPIVRRLPWWPEWLDNWDNPAHFRDNDTSSRLQNVGVPVLHFGGWYDLFLRNTYEHYKKISTHAKDAAVAANQRLMIGPWAHAVMDCISCAPNAAIDDGALQMAWMDRWFNGKPNAFFDYAVVLYVMGENRWRAEDSWPLTGVRPTRYYFRSQGAANSAEGDGALSNRPPGHEPPDSFTYDPRNPASTPGWNALSRGRTEQSATEARADVLVFTSPELAEDVEVTGEVSATLYAASSATDTDWWVKLVDVAPDGKAYLLTSGLARARYRFSRTEPQSLTPGKIEKYALNLWATSNVFKKGHRIRVEVTSSNFPHADRNPNTFVDLSRATEKDFVVASQTVYHDAKHPSHVELPIIPRSRARKWIETPFPRVTDIR